MVENCVVIAIFSIYGQFQAIWKPDSRCIFYKSLFINSPFILQKLKTELKNLWHNSHNIVLSKGTTILAKKRWFFPKKCWH